MTVEIWKSVWWFGRSQGGGGGLWPPPAGSVTNQTLAGRGLINLFGAAGDSFVFVSCKTSNTGLVKGDDQLTPSEPRYVVGQLFGRQKCLSSKHLAWTEII